MSDKMDELQRLLDKLASYKTSTLVGLASIKPMAFGHLCTRLRKQSDRFTLVAEESRLDD